MNTINTKELLIAIQNRLKAELPDVAVELYPEKPTGWRLNHPKGALLVDFRGAAFGNAKDSGLALTERTLSFGVSVVARTLYAAFGGLELLDKTRQALNGFVLPHCKKILPKSEKFVGSESGLWVFEFVFSTQTVELET